MRCIYPSLLCTVPLNCIIDKYTSEVNNSSDTIHLPSFVHIYMQSGRLAGLGSGVSLVLCIVSWCLAGGGESDTLPALVLETGWWCWSWCWCWGWCRCESLPGSSSHMGRGSAGLFWAPAAFHLYLHAGPGPGPSATMGQGEVVIVSAAAVTGSRLLQLRIK